MTSRSDILIIQTAYIGDVVLVTPLLSAIKRHFPNSRVHVLVIPESVNVLENNPHVDRIVTYDKRGKQKGLYGLWAMARLLGAFHYGIVFAPHRSLRTALLSRSTGAPLRIGFDKNSGRWCYTHRIHYEPLWHEIDRNLSLLSALGISCTSEPPQIYPDEQDRDNVDQMTALVESKRTWVALAPGSVWPTKRWPEADYKSLAGLLANSGHIVFLLGGQTDQELCRRLSAGASQNIIDTSGRLSLRSSAELLRRCKLLVTNDSAPMHLASAMATTTIALFGPTIPAFGFGPYGNLSHVLELDLACRPCSTHGGITCPIKTHDCLRLISAQAVYSKSMELLNRK
jgi:heptosyltransferase II